MVRHVSLIWETSNKPSTEPPRRIADVRTKYIMSTLSRWLQPPPKDSLEQQYRELADLLRTKERVLETTSHDLKVKTAAMQILEQKIMSSEMQFSSTQRELTARGEQLKALEAELAVRSKRLTDVEAEGVAARQRVNELNSTITALV